MEKIIFRQITIKRLLSIFITIVMSITLLPASANAENIIESSGFQFDTETGAIIKYTGNEKEVEIPDSINGVVVKGIGYRAFENCSNLTSITLPDKLEWIGDSTFFNCSSLKSIEIPDSVTSIGSSAFLNCSSLKSIEIPDSVTSIGSSAFENCSSLTNIIIPDNVISIEYETFWNCISLKSIEIPDSVTSIGDNAFRNCGSLTNITIPESVTSIGYNAFSNCSSLTNITIPESVIRIDGGAFENCSGLTSITISGSITVIGHGAFQNCGLININILENVKDIKMSEFTYCKNLNSINVDENNLNYVSKEGVLYSKGFSKLIIYPQGKTENEYIIPDSVKDIDEYAFNNCINLKSVKIPDGVKNIGKYAFSNCINLKSIEIPDSVISIGKLAFSGCSSMESITLSEKLTSIEEGLFKDCDKLKNITIPDSVENITMGYMGAFIPRNVMLIYGAFYGCKSLIFIDVEKNNLFYASKDGILYDKEMTRLIYCPPNNLKEELIIPDSVTSIDIDAFLSSNNLTSIIMTDKVVNIGEHAFAYCKKLISVTIASNEVTFQKSPVYVPGGDIGGWLISNYVYRTFEGCGPGFIIYGVKGSETEEVAKAHQTYFYEIGTKFFYDIDNYDWVKNQINYLLLRGIIKGTSENTFTPATQIKRADFMLLLVRMFGEGGNDDDDDASNDVITDNFDDVSPDAYYYSEIGIAKKLGLAEGTGNNMFEPEAPISRQDMFVLTYRILKEKAIIESDSFTEDILKQFEDQGEISEYAHIPLATLVENEYIKGSEGKLNPLNNSSRAETTMLVYRIQRTLDTNIS